MTDGDRSCEIEVRRKQENTKAGVFSINVEWRNNKIQCHAVIISNNNNYCKVVIKWKSMPVGCVISSAEWCRVLAALLYVESGLLALDVPGLQ